MVRAIITLLLGTYFLLIGFGKVKVSKNPAANTNFIQKWGTFFRIAGVIIVIAGIVLLISAL
jgi:uncharacterized membrane protein YphA (DoxX/SURF4 family)